MVLCGDGVYCHCIDPSNLAATNDSLLYANTIAESNPIFVSVNPASSLGSKMVKEAYGTSGKNLSIGAEILIRAALSAEFDDEPSRYNLPLAHFFND